MTPWRTWAMGTLFFVAAVDRGNIDTRTMVTVAGGLGLRLVVCILGPMRRCSGHWLLHCAAMAAYYLPGMFVGFIVKAVMTSSGGNIFNAQWGVLLLLETSQRAVEMVQYARGDKPHQRLGSFIYMFSLCYLIFSLYVTDPAVTRIIMTPSFLVFYGAIFIYWGLTFPVAKSAEGRMKEHSEMTLRADMVKCRDVWLSYSNCRRLTRLYYDIPWNEEQGDVLQQKDLESNYRRVLDIVDVQLGFLHDYFFTGYHSMIRYPPSTLSAAQETLDVLKHIALHIAGIIFAVVCNLAGLGFGEYKHMYIGFGKHKLFNVAVLVVGYTIEWTNKRPIVPMYWRTFLKNYHSTGYRPTFVQHFVECYQSVNCLGKPYWQNKIGQYSLIEDYDRRNHMKACLAWFKKHLLAERPVFKYHHPEEEEPASFPESVKKSVAEEVIKFLKKREEFFKIKKLTIPKETEIQRLTRGNISDTILIWHIATWYCHNIVSDQDKSSNREVATLLSGYCAYLVAFHPDLLPGESKTTTMVFEHVWREAETKMSSESDDNKELLQLILQKARALLGMPRTMEEKKKMVKQIVEKIKLRNGQQLTTFENGIKLGKLLVERDNQTDKTPNDHKGRWTVMAEFWVETILYVAPSKKADAHVDRLVQGGEFVTHLWALLADVGVLEQSRKE